MLKKKLLTLAVIIAVINTVIAGYEYIWPLIDTSGVIETGEYRGLKIGDTKRDVIRKTIYTMHEGSLRITFYREHDGNVRYLFSKREEETYNIYASDEWGLSYPGIHGETLKIFFKNRKLYKITYVRDMFAP